MLIAPQIDPIAFSIGPLKLHWYGLTWVLAFGLAWWLGIYRAGKTDSGWTKEQVSDVIFYGALGSVLGGRLGYVLFYKPGYYLDHPLEIFYIWQGGMSFHGGMLGAILALWWLARSTNRHWMEVTDFVAPLVPLGLGSGRIGNFINQELWGRVTDVPWAMVFRTAGPQPRHPSQLYEFALEGVALFVIVWLFSSKPRPMAMVTGLALLCYGVFRFFVEFFRQPDAHLGFIAMDWLTMGHLLSAPMVLVGALIMWWAAKRQTAT